MSTTSTAVELARLQGAILAGAQSRGLRVWDGWPSNAPAVQWDQTGDVDAFLDLAVELGIRLLYVQRPTSAPPLLVSALPPDADLDPPANRSVQRPMQTERHHPVVER